MFPLAGKTFPGSAEELESAINEALAEYFDATDEQSVASVSGEFPKLKSVMIDLDDAEIRTSKTPPKPKPGGKRQRGPTVQKFDLSAQPIRYEQAGLYLKLTASDLKFDFDRDRKGAPMLVLTGAGSGKVDARISKADIEALATEAATMAAEGQGITIQELDLKLTSSGPRSIAAEVRVKARKLLVSGVIHITGQLDIDDELNATISDLECTGEGLIGNTAAALVQPKLKPYDGKTIPLMTFSLGDVVLKDVKIDVAKKDLHVTAAFAEA